MLLLYIRLMQLPQLHKAQASILYTLRHNTAARYTVLMQPTGLESDMFKFHLARLISQGYIEKQPFGTYSLTTRGKEFANNLDSIASAVLRQPKVSVAIVAARQRDDETEYLLHQRRRNPYYGYWGLLTGPVKWSKSFESTAEHEFNKQTGLDAAFEVKAFSRQTDHQDASDTVLEDKVFVIISATHVSGDLKESTHIGNNQWMSLAKLEQQEKFFPATRDFIETLEANRSYLSQDNNYAADRY